MTRPLKIPERQLERVRWLEDQLERAARAGELNKAKVALDDLKPILNKYHHTARLLQAYLKLYEGALESWNLDVAKRGFEFVRNQAGKNTRIYLEATALLAISHLREQNTFSAEPLMAEVLRNEEIIKSEKQRTTFRQEIIDRFDQEGALAALADCHPDLKSESEIHQEAVRLLRQGKTENDMEELIGANTPQSVKDFLLKVDTISKNLLPHEERLLLPSPKEVVKNRQAGRVLFQGVRRKIYFYVCDKDSKIYQAWLHEGIDAILNKGYVASAVVGALADLRIGAGAIAVGVTAALMKMGVETYCKKNKPNSLMSLRKRSNKHLNKDASR